MNNFKVLFLYPSPRKSSLPPSSIALFSRILKDHGYAVELFDSTGYELEGVTDSGKKKEELLIVHSAEEVDYSDKKDWRADLNKKFKEFNPDLIAVSCTESTFLLGVEMIRNIKGLNVPVLFGGVFTTFAPEKALSFKEVDMVCVGEGEELVLELCEKMRKGEDYSKLAGLWLKDKNGNIIKNPLRAPIDINKNPTNPDFEIFEERRLLRPMAGKLWRMAPVETHRGCTFTCTFCNSPAQNKMYQEKCGVPFFRKKSIDKVREEILYAIKNLKVEYIYFWADNLLAMNDNELEEFCKMYSEFKLPFFAQARPENITEKRFKMLRDVGLHRLAVGLEQGNEEFRKRILKRMYSNKQAIDNLKIISDLGISFSTFNMVGLPDETPELAADTVELNRQVKSDSQNYATFTPFFGAPLRDYAVQKGYMDPDIICSEGPYEDSVLDMPQFTKEQINGKKRTFAMYIKFPKERWSEIALAEKFTEEGNAKWKELQKEFKEKFFN